MPTAEESAQTFVVRQWKEIHTNRSRHFLSAPVVRSIENLLERRQQAITESLLSDGVDWTTDLEIAKSYHKHNLDWLAQVDKEHESYIDYWKSICANTTSAGEKLSLAGLNTIYLVHGAVAVGALNALAAKPVANDKAIAAAAKFAMPSALIGIAMVSIGQLILARYGMEMAARVSGKLIGTVTRTRSRSFGRYWSKYHRLILAKSDYLIYGSIVWFFTYSLVAYFILVN